VIPTTICDRPIHTEELLEMNLKRPDASQDEFLREEPEPGGTFVRQAVVAAETFRRNQDAEQ
jgi:hypothetical protein